MTDIIEDFLLVGFVVALAANLVASLLKRDWTFVPSAGGVRHSVFAVWAVLVPILACSSLLQWVSSFFFIVVAIGGQMAFQFSLAVSKLRNEDSRTGAWNNRGHAA